MALVEKALAAFDKVTKTTPWDIDDRVYRANADLIGIAWKVKQGQATQASFDEAIGPLRDLAKQERHHAEFYLKLAELHALQASWLLAQKKDARIAVTQGLDFIAKALHLHPTMATGLKARGHLLLLRVKMVEDGPDRQADETRAKDLFEMAKKATPSLRRNRVTS